MHLFFLLRATAALEVELLESGDVAVARLCLGSSCAASGAPRSTYSAVLDTASDLLIVPCSSCRHCGPKAPGFDPSASRTSSRVRCARAEDCAAQSAKADDASNFACRSGACHFSIAFEDGGAAYGELVRDSVWAATGREAMNVTFGCAHGMTGTMRAARIDGVFGISLNGLRRLSAARRRVPRRQRPTAPVGILAAVAADVAAGLAAAESLVRGSFAAPAASARRSMTAVAARICLGASGGGRLTLDAPAALAPLTALAAASPGADDVGARVLAIAVGGITVRAAAAARSVTLPRMPMSIGTGGAQQHGAWRSPPGDSQLGTLQLPPLASLASLAAAAASSAPLEAFDAALDTGSSFSFLPAAAFRGLRRAFEAACAARAAAGTPCAGEPDESYDAAMCWRVVDDAARYAAPVPSTARGAGEGRANALALAPATIASYPMVRIELAAAAFGGAAAPVALDVTPRTYLHMVHPGVVCAAFFPATLRRRRRRRRLSPASAALGLSALRGTTLLLDSALDPARSAGRVEAEATGECSPPEQRGGV